MLVDPFFRQFKYLRLSLTDRCNFRCSYCLPNGYRANHSEQNLTLREIENLAQAFKSLGVEKVRLTGGEPTLRPDLIDIISSLKSEVGIQNVMLTTNGFRLQEKLKNLKNAGLDGINISIDSLDESRFKEISGKNSGFAIKSAVDHALDVGFKSVKVNCVLLKDLNDDEIVDFQEWVRTRPITVRFIELMKTCDNTAYFSKHYLSPEAHIEGLLKLGWRAIVRTETAGPALEFDHTDYQGRLGFISAYRKNFCDSCNRLRVSSRGALRLCLFGEGDVSLRPFLQNKNDHEELVHQIHFALQIKPQGHRLHENKSGTMASLSAIGG